ncbi:MAG: methyltransferase [Treponema sp.]|nr:methyltransferase [Treponema sp.]
MATGDMADCRIEGITATGSGLAHINNGCIFVDLTAPHDLVRVRITTEQKGWARADLLEILEPSPLRVQPVCPLCGNCGGCNLGHINYAAQLEAKKSILLESFIRTGGFTPPQIRVIPSPPIEYRNRVQFHTLRENRKIIGFMERRRNEIIPLPDCPVADPGIRDALKNPQKNLLKPPVQKDRFTVYSRGDVFLTEGTAGRGRILLGKKIEKEMTVDAGVFFQSNSIMLEFLLEDLIILAKKCDPGLPMADIYCGVGTFSVFLGDFFENAVLVEENKIALGLARENTGVKKREFYAVKADDWVKQKNLAVKQWGLIVLDPPRTGLTNGIKQFLRVCKTQAVAYVSCDPVTLARDSRDLINSGFFLKELTLYDFYPQTSHIESLAVFVKEDK